MSVIKLFFLLLVIIPSWCLSAGIVCCILGISTNGDVVQLTGQILYKNLILAPFVIMVEEILFRYIPMMLFVFLIWLFRKWITMTFKVILLTIIIVISSFLFGISHGGIVHVFIQGVYGVGLCLIYVRVLFDLKSSPSSRWWQLRPLLASNLLHLGVNLILFILQLGFMLL